MIRYVHDLYPRTDPLGARIRRFSQLQQAAIIDQRNGTGSGGIALRGSSTDAGDIDPLGLQYVRTSRVNTAIVDGSTLSGYDELVVHGFFFEQGDFDAIDREQKRLLKFEGAGALSYLDREVMWSHAYLDISGFGDMDPFDQIWRLYAAGTGNELGAILWRVITEAQGFRSGVTPYTHRHGDGTTHTDIHDDDRRETAIPAVTMTFTADLDSSGNAWTVSSGDFTAQIGESVLSVVRRLMEAGLYVYLDPDTFELSAWEVANHGRDRTGLAWAADVLRFEPSPDGNRSTGNVLADVKRAIRALIRRNAVLAGGQDDIFGYASDATVDVPWHGFYPSDVADVDALDAVAARQITALNDAGDTVRVRIKVGNDPGNGYYLPGEHVLADDLATLHSGTGTWDWNESAYPVAQWGIATDRTGRPDAWVDLGSHYSSTADRRFQVAGGLSGRHSHPPNPRLCEPGTAEIADAVLYGPLGFNEVGGETVSIYPSGTGTWPDNPVYVSSSNPDPYEGAGRVGWGGSFVDHGPCSPHLPATPGVTYRWDLWAVSNAVVDMMEVNFYDAADTELASNILTPSAGLSETWTQFVEDFTAPPGTAYMRLHAEGGWGVSTYGGYDLATVTALTGTAGDPRDGHVDLVTNNKRAARCGHRHDLHRDTAPTVNDDEGDGYHVGTIWAQLDSLVTPTAIVAVWQLLDATEGNAVWAEWPAGLTDHGALTGLADDDHTQYVLKTLGGKETVSTVASSGTTETLDLASGNWHDVTLTDNCTFTFAGATNGVGCSFLLILRQDATGSRTATWPAGVEWPDGVTPALSTDPNAVDIFSFLSRDGGTTWFGSSGSVASVVALDDLSDVTITTPTAADRLRYSGSAWVNSSLKWILVTTYDGTNWLPAVDGSGNAIVTEA